MPNKPLKGKIALITGASAGIGRAIAIKLAQEGVDCVLAARREEGLKETAKEVEKAGSKGVIVPTDVTKEEDLVNLVETAVSNLGGVNILINNAGVFYRSKVEDLKAAELEKSLATNLMAPMILTKLTLPYLKKQKGSAVINMASVAAKMGFSDGSAYCASKYGLLGFSESLFEEVREEGIKVCALCPGFIKTSMVTGRPGLDAEKMIPPEEVAQTVFNILTLSNKACPTEIILRPQYSPYL